MCRSPRDRNAQPVCEVDLIVANVDLLEELVGAPLEVHAGVEMPRGREVDSGRGAGSSSDSAKRISQSTC
eukprot:8498400-Pyramimonas_sp.AAC.1